MSGRSTPAASSLHALAASTVPGTVLPDHGASSEQHPLLGLGEARAWGDAAPGEGPATGHSGALDTRDALPDFASVASLLEEAKAALDAIRKAGKHKESLARAASQAEQPDARAAAALAREEALYQDICREQSRIVDARRSYEQARAACVAARMELLDARRQYAALHHLEFSENEDGASVDLTALPAPQELAHRRISLGAPPVVREPTAAPAVPKPPRITPVKPTPTVATATIPQPPCSICFRDLDGVAVLTCSICKEGFHAPCMVDWGYDGTLSVREQCPLCCSDKRIRRLTREKMAALELELQQGGSGLKDGRKALLARKHEVLQRQIANYFHSHNPKINHFSKGSKKAGEELPGGKRKRDSSDAGSAQPGAAHGSDDGGPGPGGGEDAPASYRPPANPHVAPGPLEPDDQGRMRRWKWNSSLPAPAWEVQVYTPSRGWRYLSKRAQDLRLGLRGAAAAAGDFGSGDMYMKQEDE